MNYTVAWKRKNFVYFSSYCHGIEKNNEMDPIWRPIAAEQPFDFLIAILMLDGSMENKKRFSFLK